MRREMFTLNHLSQSDMDSERLSQGGDIIV
jgi:hypothetical protein